MRSPEQIEAIKKEIQYYTDQIAEKDKEIKNFLEKKKAEKSEIRKLRAKLVSKIKYSLGYPGKYVKKKDFTKTKAYQLFGKRLRDLTKEEKNKYISFIKREMKSKRSGSKDGI